MKQAEDTFTADMFGTPTSGKYSYRFYVTTTDGATTEWTGLTKTRARQMHAYTTQSQPSNVTAFGWEEMK